MSPSEMADHSPNAPDNVRCLDTPGSASELHLEQGVPFGANGVITQSLGSLSVSDENLKDLVGCP